MLKLFCPDGHSWFSETLRAICARCGKPVAGAMNVAGYRLVMDRVWLGIGRSISIHGDWRDYGLCRIAWVILSEVREVVWAFLRGDITGPHGVINELRDLAVVCVKGIERLEGMKHGKE